MSVIALIQATDIELAVLLQTEAARIIRCLTFQVNLARAHPYLGWPRPCPSGHNRRLSAENSYHLAKSRGSGLLDSVFIAATKTSTLGGDLVLKLLRRSMAMRF